MRTDYPIHIQSHGNTSGRKLWTILDIKSQQQKNNTKLQKQHIAGFAYKPVHGVTAVIFVIQCQIIIIKNKHQTIPKIICNFSQ